MQYICLIYSDHTTGPQPGTPEFVSYLNDYQTFTQEVRESGALVAGDALQPVSTSTCVSLESGKLVVTDGPFAETKEQLGGYYLLECKDLDEAIAYAGKIPTATHGRIEVRPIQTFDD